MTTIYVVAPADSEVGVVTNSSSMMYVARHNANIEAIAEAVESYGVGWWLGNPITITDRDTLIKFCIENSHVLKRLFDELYAVPELEPGIGDNESLRLTREADIAEKAYGINSNEYKAARDARMSAYRREWDMQRRATDAHAIACASVLERLLPITYFAAGEDSDISYEDMCKLEELPLNRARLS